MQAIGKRHIIVYVWILWEGRDTISLWMLWKDRGIRWAEECFFISYMTFSQQVQYSSLQILNNPSALRSLWYSCMTMDGTLKKVMAHCWCHFHKWETLDSNSNSLQTRLICPVHVLAWEKWSWRRPLVLISFCICKMLHGTWAKYISRLHKSSVSSHNMITLSAARLLWSKMFKKKKKLWWLVVTCKSMDYVVNSSGITGARGSTCMRWTDLVQLQFQKINFLMREKLTLSTRRARRRFSTRTTGVKRRGFLTRWRNSGRAKRSTR